MSILDEYIIDPKLSLLDKTRIQAQVLVPVPRALRSELGREKADAVVKQALRDWSKQLFTAVGDSVDCEPHARLASGAKRQRRLRVVCHDIGRVTQCHHPAEARELRYERTNLTFRAEQ